MKKILLFVVSVLVAATMFAQGAVKSEIQCLDQNARIEKGTRGASDWGTFTSFTATDMNGVEHNIQSYLDQGKYVAIDFFCAWCGPCWSYHQSGIFEELYERYGQGGTGEFVVLMVESETTNTAAQITHESSSGTSSNHDTYSQGDFTNGGTNPIPIIDATTHLSSNVSIYEGYVPSIYVICPSGYVAEINGYFLNATGTNFLSASEGAQNIYNFATSGCPTEESLPIVDISKPTVAKMGQTATISSTVVSTSDFTYAWTFEGGTPETATTASVDVVWDTEGQHNITLVVTNVNGPTTVTAVIDVVDCTGGISEFPFVEDFENGQGCWDFISMNTENEDVFGVVEYSDGMHGAFFNSYAYANNYNQYMISPELHHTRDLNLSFKYKKLDTNTQSSEKFYVKYSTTDTQTTHFTTIGSVITVSSTSWSTYEGVIPANAKYFMINYASNYKYYLVIDDLSLEEVPEENPGDYIDNSMANSISIFPNPTTGIVNIEAEGLNKVVVYDVTGRMMMSVANESTIDISNLEAGVY
ncbi:MAG: choice-of-anchor J domain-containing protein, partial [Bacteroidales bacterium]|nr:choice-of-anchor J domain-containing protein [Bacteroidales bacterium]